MAFKPTGFKKFSKAGPGRNTNKVYRKANGVSSIRRPYTEDWDVISASVKARDGYRCQKCGVHRYELKTGEHLEVHHIRPVNRGGASVKTNLWTLCSICHSLQPGHMHLRKPPKQNLSMHRKKS